MTHGPGGCRRAAAAGFAGTLLGVGLVAGCSPAPPATTSSAAVSSDPVSSASSAGSDAGDQTYGSLPSWLPRSTEPVGRVVAASAAQPAVGIEGDTLRVDLPQGHVLVTAVGPSVPEEGHFPIPASTRCTFTVTMSGATAPVGLLAAEWSSVDERSRLHRLRLLPRTPTVVPASVGVGRTVSFDLVADLPPGSGALMWAPAGGRTVGTWDFDVEID